MRHAGRRSSSIDGHRSARHNMAMVKYEYLTLTFGREVGRGDIRRLLTEHAEYGHWELDRTLI